MTLTRAPRPRRRNPAPGSSFGPSEVLTSTWVEAHAATRNGVALFYEDANAEPVVRQVVRSLASSLPTQQIVTPMPHVGAVIARRSVIDARGAILLLEHLDSYTPPEMDAMARELGPPHRAPRAPAFLRPIVVALSGPRDPTAANVKTFVYRAVHIGLSPFFVDAAPHVWAIRGVHGGAWKSSSPSSSTSTDLAHINAHRRKIGMRPLDPAAAGWSDEDVALEADRLRADGNPRTALLAWAT